MFAIDKDGKIISKLEIRSFAEEGLKERYDLQEWLDKMPDSLGEELLIIQKEFYLGGTRERMDLLALDRDGRLVIIENKRDDSGRDAVGQALRYVACCSILTRSKIVQVFGDYRGLSREEAVEAICEFLEVDDIEEVEINKGTSQRFILVAANFRDEVTSTALWLRDNGIDARCMKTTLFRHGDDLFLEIRQIVPAPETKDYMIEISEKGKEEKGTSKGRQSNQRFWEKTLDYFKDRNLRLYQNVTHTEYSTIATGTGIGGCSYICKKGKDEAWVEFHIYNSNWSRKKTEAVFNFLHGYKDLIEEKFGAELRWNQMKGTKRCRIYFSRPVENYEDEEKRREIIEWFYEHIKKLDIAFKPFSPNLRQFIGTT